MPYAVCGCSAKMALTDLIGRRRIGRKGGILQNKKRYPSKLRPFGAASRFSCSGKQPSFAVAQTMTFLVMGLTTVVHVYNCRTHLSVFQKGRGVNKLVIGTTLLGAAIMILIAVIPPVAQLFGLVPLGIWHWVIVFSLSLTPLIYVEILKLTKHFKRI